MPLLTPEQVATQLGLSVETLKAWRTKARTKGPRFIKMGVLVRYRQAAVDAWVRKCEESIGGATHEDSAS